MAATSVKGVGTLIAGIKSAGGGLGGLGGLISGGAIIAGAKASIEFAGALQDQSDTLGVATEKLQGYQGALSQSGVDAAQFTKAMTVIIQSMQQARDNTGTARESFEKLGITWKDIAADSPDRIMLKIADGLHGATNPTQAFAAALDLVGARAYKMVGALKQGGGALEVAASEIKKLTADEVAHIDSLGDAWDRATTAAKVYGGIAIESLSHTGQGTGGFQPYASDTALSQLVGGIVNAVLPRISNNRSLGDEADAWHDKKRRKREGAGPDLATSETGAVPGMVDPREQAAWDKQVKEQAEAFDKGTKAMIEGSGEVMEARHKMYLESLEGETKMKALVLDRHKAEAEFLAADGPRRIELSKEYLRILAEQLKLRKEITREAEKERQAFMEAAEKNAGTEQFGPTWAELHHMRDLDNNPLIAPGGFNWNTRAGLTSGRLRTGGLQSGGLSTGDGGGNAYGLVRRGDKARRAAEAAASAKEGDDPLTRAAVASAKNTAAIAKAFGVSSSQPQ